MRRSRRTRRSRCPPADRRPGWTHHRCPTVGHDHRHRGVRRGAPVDGTASFDVGAGDAAGLMCPAVPSKQCASECWRSPPNRRGAHGAIKRWHLRGGVSADRGPRPGAWCCSRSPLGVRSLPHRRVRRERSRSSRQWQSSWAMDRGGRAFRVGARSHRRTADARLRVESARLRRRRAGRRYTEATCRKRTGNSHGRCVPDLQVRSDSSLVSRCGSGCNWQRCTGQTRTTRPHATYCARSTTSCSTAPISASSSKKCRSSATLSPRA